MDSRDIVIRPIITERGTDSMAISRYTFEVSVGANKHQIKKAVEDLFKVHVLDVNTMIVKGKFRGMGRLKGKRRNWKKAVVSLREGDSIPLFEGT